MWWHVKRAEELIRGDKVRDYGKVVRVDYSERYVHVTFLRRTATGAPFTWMETFARAAAVRYKRR